MPRVVKQAARVYSEKEIRDALALRYPAPQFGLLSNVSCGVGRVQRFADALVMSLFPSRGLELNGVEIKSTRSDWLRELKNPAKADPIFQYCNRWHLVVSNADIVKADELPESWGLLAMTEGGTLRQIVAAPKLDPHQLDAPFMAAIFRRATEQSTDARTLAAVKAEALNEGREREKRQNEHAVKYATERLDEALRRIRDFETASGLSISGWQQPREIGEAVRAVLNGEAKRARQRLVQIRNVASEIVETLDKELETQTREGHNGSEKISGKD